MQSTTMNSVFLECYLAHNLGDDLFLETLLRRYPDVHFTCVVDGSYDWLLERYHNISLVRPPRKKSALGGASPFPATTPPGSSTTGQESHTGTGDPAPTIGAYQTW